ncbi:hypothetical protein N7492_004254 [Penicillium capsulatum]|uniref:Short chain oxidoreductase n=1 Tax=Penicillium capsulatum TaxID=69766 RepID=A0A9W9I9X4_9EURO|nr:hypothetical protein N7492_004254 [Penicillium capsulatum]
MASFLITGSSRGLGLALVSRLAALSPTEVGTIFATARQDNSPQLDELVKASAGRVERVTLDVTSPDSIQQASREVERRLQGRGLDYLINNAGVMDWSPANLESMDNLDEVFHINVTSVHLVTRAFLPLLRQGEKKMTVNVSTTLGSIGWSHIFKEMPSPAYKVSKAALSMLTVQYDHQYAKEGLSFLAISPGWLRTDLGGSRADLPVEVGAEKVVDLVQKASPEDSGKFWNIHVPGWEDSPRDPYHGGQVPW